VRTHLDVRNTFSDKPGISLIQGIPVAPDGGSVTVKGRTSVPTYLVERYWPGVTSELLLEALDRGRRVMRQMSAEGTDVRDVVCILIPGEEVVFSMYEGPSAAAVSQLNDRADIPVSRIVEAITMPSNPHRLLAQMRHASPARSVD
jgi:hypothetical protein